MYSKLLRNQEKYEFLKNKNIVFRDLKNQIFLTKDLNKDEFKPVHTPYSFSCKVVSSFDDVYNGIEMGRKMIEQLGYKLHFKKAAPYMRQSNLWD